LSNLHLKTFGIKNFRSIGENGFFLEKLKKINLFVGKNNCGKSKFLSLFSSSTRNNKNNRMVFGEYS